MNWLQKIAQSPTKSDIMAIRPVLRTWISGGYDDRGRLLRLLIKHQDILRKFTIKSPVRVWRNERAESSVSYAHNKGWEDQYNYPTAWSMNRYDAEGYGGNEKTGRRLVTAIAQPDDVFCSIPLVEYYVQQLGLKPIDVHQQSEIIIKPNPSFLDKIRPPTTMKEAPALREELERLLLQLYLPMSETYGTPESHIRSTISVMVDRLDELVLVDRINDTQAKLNSQLLEPD